MQLQTATSNKDVVKLISTALPSTTMHGIKIGPPPQLERPYIRWSRKFIWRVTKCCSTQEQANHLRSVAYVFTTLFSVSKKALSIYYISGLEQSEGILVMYL